MKRRLNLFLFGFSLGLWLSGCQKHVSANTNDVVHRPGYAYQRLNDGEFLVGAANHQAFERALDEIGCGKKYVCAVETAGDYYDVQVHAK